MLLIRVNSVALYSVGPVSYSITMNGSHEPLPPFDSLSVFEPRLGIRLSLESTGTLSWKRRLLVLAVGLCSRPFA